MNTTSTSNVTFIPLLPQPQVLTSSEVGINPTLNARSLCLPYSGPSVSCHAD